MCRQCFRKLTVLANGVKEFREVCFKTNQKLQLEKARLKRGRNASSPTQGPQQKRHKQIQTAEFAVRHFNGNILPIVEVVQTRNNNLSPSRVPNSSFPEQPILTVDFAYNSCSCCRDKQRSHLDEQTNQLSASQILKNAGLRNTEVSPIIVHSFHFILFIFTQVKINYKSRTKARGLNGLMVRKERK